MAKATATCTCTTCGNTFEKIAYKQNRREADSWEEWAATYYDECDDCYRARIQREREEKNAKAAAEAQENEFPPLTGSEKQIAWAITLRQKAFDAMVKAVSGLDDAAKTDKEAADAQEETHRFMDWLFSTKITAHWWIDHRDMCECGENRVFSKAQDIYKEFKEQDAVPAETANEADAREAAQQDMTVEPQRKNHNGVVEIAVSDTDVTAKYPRDDDFRSVVKSIGYVWDKSLSAWTKRINATTGAAQERAAELGNKLLNAGFAIRIADPETRQAAINGRYEPEHHRWISAYTDGKLCIRLTYGDGMYNRAKAITGAKYSKPNVEVDPKNFEEIEDFAARYDYRITPKAQALIDAEKAKIVAVVPAAAKTAAYDEHDPAEILISSADVLDDLRED